MTAVTPALIDTHAHLDDPQFVGDVDLVIARAHSAGVNRIINIGYRPAVWQTTLALAERQPLISYALGMHPLHADEWNSESEAELLRLLRVTQPVALGEIGLDFFRNLTPPEIQEQVFRRQLEIAVEMDLPVVIHQRAAEDAVMAVLRDAPGGLACVLHSYDGTAELARFAVESGYYIGVGGLMTRSKSTDLREVLRNVPFDRIVLETDSPYLVPAKIKQRRNEPANVRIVAEHLAELLGESLIDIVRTTSNNAYKLFSRLPRS